MLTCVNANAAWRGEASADAYFTDDVALFSVTRRLSLQDDPTQPIVDRPQQGGDFVFEPKSELAWKGANAWGEIAFSADAGAYLFVDNPVYSHAMFETRASQAFATGTQIELEYNLVPDMFLGKNDYMQNDGLIEEYDEQLTSHFWAFIIDQALNDQITLRLLSRYGLRDYNEPFRHRNTRFWTLGPHVEWRISPNAELLVGYHYEQGQAQPDRATGYADDVSYINHYASAELNVRLLERLSAIVIFDFEKTDFTATQPRDEHYGAYENVYQGEIELLYELDETIALKLGWQHGQRKLSSEHETIRNNNAWLGIEYSF